MQRRAGSACALSALLAAVALASILLPGCSRTSPQSQQPEELSFAVSDSLLGPAILIDETDTSLRPPSAFAAVSDSVLQVLRKSGLPSSEEQGAEQLRVEPGAELVAAFLDSARRAGLAVFVRRHASHGEEYAAAYEQGLRSVSEQAEVRSGDYVVNDVYIRNFLVSSPSMIRFHLLCFSERPDATELVYFADRSSYPDLVRAFESSIGTIKQTGKGG
jgi:hypothetical protein